MKPTTTVFGAAEHAAERTEASPNESAAQSPAQAVKLPVGCASFLIEKNIPIAKKAGGGRNGFYPWAQMDVGDSFFVPGKTTRTFSSAVIAARKSHGFKFTTRTETKAGVLGVRVWRTA